MNKEIVLFILPVIYFIGSERYVSDYHVKKVIRVICFLKSFNLDIGIWI